jgi:hypothetical protein
MEHCVCWLEAVPGHPPLRDQRRGLAFLVHPKDRRVTAKDSFNELPRQIKKKLHTAMDYWLGGFDNKPAHHHGWDKSEYSGKYVMLWVFKCRDDQAGHRLYGFLQNPDPRRQRLRVCVLVEYSSKDRDETDEAILRRVESIRIQSAVIKAVEDYAGRLT